MIDRRNFFSMALGLAAAPAVAAHHELIATPTGAINVSFTIPPPTPEQIREWLYKNKAGLSAAITDSVRAMERKG